jgi:hypothetical protein
MDLDSREPGIVDLATYRVARAKFKAKDEVVTDVHFMMTRSGAIVDNSIRVASLDTLTVLMWCLALSSNVLGQYLGGEP